MREVITTIIIAVVTGFLGWFFSNLKTKRERKKSDLQFVSEAVSPLVQSIRELTEQNNELIGKLMIEQDKVIRLASEKAELIKEKGELIEKIEHLEKKIETLSRKIDNINKKRKEHETDINS